MFYTFSGRRHLRQIQNFRTSELYENWSKHHKTFFVQRSFHKVIKIMT